MRAPFCRVALLLFSLTACRGDAKKPGGPIPSASSVPAVAPSLAPPAAPPPPSAGSGESAGPRLLEIAKSCRALDVKGRIIDDSGKTLQTSAPLDRAVWLTLDPGARLALKHAETSRELTFSGPGRVRPCVAGEERFDVIRGGVRTTLAAGARPGAEVLIATPVGVVRYGDARLEIKVDSGSISVKSDSGDAWFESPSPGGSGVVEERILPGKQLQRKGLTVDVKALLIACEAAAEAAEARARTLIHPGPSDRATPLGARAAEHMRARRAARFACAIAGAALGTTEIGGDRDALDQRLGRAEARFRGMPSAATNAEKTESR